MDADVVVIGTGPGGESLANKAARAGLEVVAVEKHLVKAAVHLTRRTRRLR